MSMILSCQLVNATSVLVMRDKRRVWRYQRGNQNQ